MEERKRGIGLTLTSPDAGLRSPTASCPSTLARHPTATVPMVPARRTMGRVTSTEPDSGSSRAPKGSSEGRMVMMARVRSPSRAPPVVWLMSSSKKLSSSSGTWSLMMYTGTALLDSPSSSTTSVEATLSELDGDVGEDASGARDVDDGPHVVLGHADGRHRQLQRPERVVAGVHHDLGHCLRPGTQPRGDTEGILDFLPGERLKFITVTIVDNLAPELDKSFRVELFNPDGGATLGVAAHITVTIAASDDAHGVFQFSPDSLAVNGTEPEDGRSAVLLQAEPSAAGAELLSSSGSVSFGVGQRRESFFVRVAQDQVPELDQHFNVTLVNVSHGRLGNERTTATLTVLASDDPYGVFVFAATARALRVPEADATVGLTIHRLKGLMGTVRVTYETLGEAEPAPYRTPGVGRASEGRDFVPLLGSVVFLPNQSEANISLQILQDEDPERDESVFVELTAVEVLETAQDRPSETINTFSQRAEAVAQVVVNASDDAFGTLQLSVSAVSVAEDYVGPIINVTRTGGIFADVSVKFRAVPITATVSEDYSVASTDVVLLEGESSKAVPVYIINDQVPELEESFLLELINQTTGGALLGDLTRAIITILPSDDPFGAFVFQAAPLTLEEPESGSVEVTLPIVRRAGTIGTVAVGWRASVDGQLAVGDLRPASGEVIKVELTGASNGGSLGRETSVDITVPANDNPYGTVFFDQPVYRIQEPLDGPARVTVEEEDGEVRLLVARAQGLLGRVTVGYRTTPFMASSPEDYEDTEGILDFLPGERLKFITVTIVDNLAPELDKSFRVELFNPDGGVLLELLWSMLAPLVGVEPGFPSPDSASTSVTWKDSANSGRSSSSTRRAPLVRSITHEMVEPSSLVWEEQEEEEEEDIEEDGEEGEVEKGEVEEGGGEDEKVEEEEVDEEEEEGEEEEEEDEEEEGEKKEGEEEVEEEGEEAGKEEE
ncbi:hypothetical protein CRUP_038335 [Coryphaenoides rupestris]|nr:hypothetical protein CRUP_038335 [Coryphaenoides rupestris]